MSHPERGVTKDDVEALQRLLEHHARLKGDDYKLSSGLSTNYYFNAKPVTLTAEGFDLVAKIMVPLVDQAGADAVGGLTMGAIPLALAIAVASRRSGKEIPAVIIRDEKKPHGTKELIAASYLFRPQEHRRVVVVDDVVTTGGSIEQAIEALIAERCDIAAIVALVTRPEAGGVEAMQRKFTKYNVRHYISVFECDLEGNLTPTPHVDRFIVAPIG